MMALEWYQILSLLGIPSLATVIGWLSAKIKSNDKKTHAVQLGVQALLRSQMINDYNRWFEKGYAPIYARENFENCWQQYHNLGANGVMDGIREKFMALPTSPPKNTKSVGSK